MALAHTQQWAEGDVVVVDNEDDVKVAFFSKISKRQAASLDTCPKTAEDFDYGITYIVMVLSIKKLLDVK